MAKNIAFECGECNSGIVLWDGWKESKFSEDEIEEFEEIVAEFGIPMDIGMCSECDLRYN
jgi:transcription initiation factor IIE alpha subunit